jgi:hypothetical protein
MELMPGKTLEDLVRQRGPLPIGEAVEMILDVIDGLQEAHHLGIIHRDVKPSNCFLEDDGRVKVGDFGLAKSLAAGVRLTGTGAFLGTPLYASPEQVRGEKLTPQTDVYSVTATLYFLLAGKAPFESGDAVSTLARIVSDDPPPVRTLRSEVPEVLDAVITRGLERSRERRYADLEQLRVALLPFLPGRSPFVGLGMRFGAVVIDHLLLWLIGMAIGMAGVIGGVSGFTADSVELASPGQMMVRLGGIVVFFLYFLPEGFLGYSVGKSLLGLRVLGVATMAPPGLWRCLLRNGVYYLLLNGATLAGVILILTARTQPDPAALAPRILLGGLLVMISTPLGIALVCCTMRTRNGQRGVHDFASGTRVVRLVRPRRRAHFRLPAPQLSSSQPAGLPSSIGAYRVAGALHWQCGQGTLVARDPSLGREVLLWLRPGVGPALDSARRSLSRITRLRWLAAGRYEAMQWDAFLLPAGCTLPDLVRSNGPLDWQDARYVLEQLTKELDLAIEEKTLPPSLSAEQVWMQANGRIVLLDPPMADETSLEEKEPATVLPLEEQEQRMSLALLREVAALVVSGEKGLIFPRRTKGRMPLPVHAMTLLRRLEDEEDGFRDLAEFQTELWDMRSRPVEVTRARRSGQLAALAGLLLIGLGCITWSALVVPLVFAIRLNQHLQRLEGGLNHFEQASAADLAVRVLSPNPWARLASVAQYTADQDLRDRLRERVERDRLKRDSRIESLSPILRGQMRMMMTGQPGGGPSPPGRPSLPVRSWPLGTAFRFEADLLLRETLEEQAETVARWTSIGLLVWPALWILWAFASRGGISYLIAGLALVRRDGRPAARWQCAMRVLLVWLPVSALLIASVWLDAWYWMAWQPDDARWWLLVLARLTWWAAFGLLAAFILLALRSPGRALNDRLAGTFVVPR